MHSGGLVAKLVGEGQGDLFAHGCSYGWGRELAIDTDYRADFHAIGVC